jgi:hypothetical protein
MFVYRGHTLSAVLDDAIATEDRAVSLTRIGVSGE